MSKGRIGRHRAKYWFKGFRMRETESWKVVRPDTDTEDMNTPVRRVGVIVVAAVLVCVSASWLIDNVDAETRRRRCSDNPRSSGVVSHVSECPAPCQSTRGSLRAFTDLKKMHKHDHVKRLPAGVGL